MAFFFFFQIEAKEYFILNETRRANLNANKRILTWKPFWTKVYTTATNLQQVPDGIY